MKKVGKLISWLARGAQRKLLICSKFPLSSRKLTFLQPGFLSRVASRKIELNADLLPKKGVSFVSHRETPFSGKQAERIEVMLLCRIPAEVPGATHSVFRGLGP